MANWVADYLERNPHIARLPVHKQARYSLQFRMPDGSIIAEFTGAPCHYLDDAQGWQPLDTTLRAIGNEYGAPGLATRLTLDGGARIHGASHAQRTGRYVIFDAATGKVKNVKQARQHGHVEDDSIISDAGAYRHVLRLTETGLRETLTLTEPVSGTAASEWLMLETELDGHDLPDGWLDDLPGRAAYKFLPPTATDGDGYMVAAKRYALRHGNRQMLYTGVPVPWLAGARYPVVIDPDYADSTNDGYVYGNNAAYATARSTAYNGSTSGAYFRCGQGVAKSIYNVYRSYLKFDTSGIGAGNTVTQVNLMLTVQSTIPTAFDVIIIKQNWSGQDPLAAGNFEAAYDNCLGGTADDNIWRNTNGLALNTQYASGNLSTAWVAITGNTYYSLISSRDIAGTTPTGAEFIGIHSQEATTSGYRPVLTVTYTAGGGSTFKQSRALLGVGW